MNQSEMDAARECPIVVRVGAWMCLGMAVVGFVLMTLAQANVDLVPEKFVEVFLTLTGISIVVDIITIVLAVRTMLGYMLDYGALIVLATVNFCVPLWAPREALTRLIGIACAVVLVSGYNQFDRFVKARQHRGQEPQQQNPTPLT